MPSLPNSASVPVEEVQEDVIKHDQSQDAMNSSSIRVGVENVEEKKKKKKRNTKPSKKRGTGFEEFFCDPPMTPEEYDEEKNFIYPPHRPFVDRIQECIQRFRARRRMDTQRELLFSRYLFLGGIDASVRQFQSTRNLDHDILDSSTKTELREITADDMIQRGGGKNYNIRYYNPNYPEHWEVDFTGVAAGFMGEELVKYAGPAMFDYSKGVEVVSSFLKYVDRHDVCPEYVEDLKNAQKVCEQALEEMPAINELITLLPGKFNTAARTLYCRPGEDDPYIFGADETHNLDKDTAKRVFGVTVAIVQYPVRNMAAMSAESALVETFERMFEIRSISFAKDEELAKCKSINGHLTERLGVEPCEPCGTMTLRPIVVRNGWDNPSAEDDAASAASNVETFIIEERILRLLQVRMKMTLGVCRLKSGLTFIKYAKEIMPTFWTFLPQALMFRFKDHVLNPRPAPSIHDVGRDDYEVDDDDEDVENVLSQIPIGDPEDQHNEDNNDLQG
ncbi:Argonaute complex, subunit Arb1 [Podospora didyma]|uniref:Argonaute complex, subunit Arb1 n=1 Tax=Podospora didyma TaxID=330526 RepID=A0AAE0U3I1_9PEZI|nr:Argonaute complex, subunit Arb1 [Podospora didyma]